MVSAAAAASEGVLTWSANRPDTRLRPDGSNSRRFSTGTPYGTTQKLREILARQSMAANETQFPAMGRS